VAARSALFRDLVQIVQGARQIAQQTRVFLKGIDCFLQLVLVALLPAGLSELLQRLEGMLVLFF